MLHESDFPYQKIGDNAARDVPELELQRYCWQLQDQPEVEQTTAAEKQVHP
jgi:hypothetical protein